MAGAFRSRRTPGNPSSQINHREEEQYLSGFDQKPCQISRQPVDPGKDRTTEPRHRDKHDNGGPCPFFPSGQPGRGKGEKKTGQGSVTEASARRSGQKKAAQAFALIRGGPGEIAEHGDQGPPRKKGGQKKGNGRGEERKDPDPLGQDRQIQGHNGIDSLPGILSYPAFLMGRDLGKGAFRRVGQAVEMESSRHEYPDNENQEGRDKGMDRRNEDRKPGQKDGRQGENCADSRSHHRNPEDFERKGIAGIGNPDKAFRNRKPGQKGEGPKKTSSAHSRKRRGDHPLPASETFASSKVAIRL